MRQHAVRYRALFTASFAALLLLSVGSTGVANTTESAATTAATTVITGKPAAATRETHALFSFSANAGAAPPAYTITELAAGVASKAMDINNAGAVVGWARVGDADHAMLWSGGSAQDLGTLGGKNSYAYAINEAGVVVGAAEGSDGVLRAVRWTGGVIEELGLSATAIAINESGQILAKANDMRAWLYSGGTWRSIDGPPPVDLNDNGLILLSEPGHTQGGTAVLSTGPGGMTTPLGLVTGTNMIGGLDLNTAGQVVGQTTLFSSEAAFFYDNGTLFDLGASLGLPWGWGLAVNDVGQLLLELDGRLRLYSDGIVYDVNDLVPAGSGWVFGNGSIGGAFLREPPAINDRGAIALTVNRWPLSHALQLAPVSGAPASSGATYECQLDGGAFAPCTPPKGYAGPLAEGAHTFSVRATDSAGTGTAATYTWTIDTQAPTVTITQQPGNPSAGNGSFGFTSEPGATFECKLDSAAYSDCTSPIGHSGLAEGSHTFAVRATDVAGNVGSPTTFTWMVDQTGPTVTITDAPAAITKATSASFAFSTEAGTTLQCKRDFEGFTDCTSPKSYSGLAAGSHTFSVRAIDTLGNIGPATTYEWTIDVCPCTLFPPSLQPATQSISTQDGRGGQTEYTYELGVGVKVDRPMKVSAIRFFKSSQETGVHVGTIWNLSGQKLATVTFSSETASGWQQQALATPFALEAGHVYVISVNANTRFGLTVGGLATTVVSGPLQSYGFTGVYAHAAGVYPSYSYQSSNYFVDLQVVSEGATTDPADTTPPTVTITQAPTSPSAERSPSFAFSSEPGVTFECKLDASPFIACSSPITYAGLAEGSHMFSVRATDAAGNVSAAASYTWTIERICPCSLFSSLAQPAVQDLPTQDGRSGQSEYTYEFGVKVKVARPMEVSALRFFKSARETGMHTGTIWSASGTKLASVTFASETASGWQRQPLATPYLLEPGVVYVISVNANTHFGLTALDLGSEIVSGPLRSVADGTNGVYGAAAGTFPANSYRSSNYFVDLEVAEAGNAPPTVTITDAPPAATVATSASFAFTSEAGATFECKLDDGLFATCSSPKSYTALAVASHTFAVRATDADGNVGPAATHGWTISADTCPCSLFSSLVQPELQDLPTQDGRSGQSSYTYELGVKVKVDRPMQVSALKFFKSTKESGTHTGTIWSASGVELTSVTFASETASGWQRQPLATPYVLEPGIVYVISVNANTHFALTGLGLANEVVSGPLRSIADGMNGVYALAAGTFPTSSYRSANYFVDLEVASAG